MFKVYKKSIVVSSFNNTDSTQAPQHGEANANQHWSMLLTIPCLLVGGLVMTVFFSAMFALLLIPAAIFGFKAKRVFSHYAKNPADSVIDAEYKIIDEKNKSV